MINVGIIGAGAWGTAFALHLARMGYRIRLWVFEQELLEILRTRQENSYYLPSFILPPTIDYTDSIKEATEFSDSIVIATPSFALRSIISASSAQLARKKLLILTKGLETKTLLRMSQVTEEVVGSGTGVAVLSGPSFAKEVAKGAFTSVVVSSRDHELAAYFQRLVHNDTFRVYTSDDVTGVELGGAMKNVMAIGTGIIEGLELGTNTQAAFITRALAEIKRLGKALGARETTFMGLSGIGDLILTSYGNLSRNRLFGVDLARGKSPDEIIGSQKMVVEGYYTTNAAYRFSKKYAIDMPITEELYKIIYEGKSPLMSVNDITRREFRVEDE